MVRNTWIIMALALGASSASLQAGPVNSPQSYPFAVMNSAGDSLSLGDLKGLFLAGDGRSAALRLPVATRVFPRFSGGLAEAEAWQADQPFAIACSNASASLFDPTRSPSHPGGRWTPVVDLPLIQKQPLQCAMQASGHYAWLALDAGRLIIEQSLSLALPFNSPDLQLLAIGDKFWLLHPDGRSIAAQKTSRGDWQWTSQQAHPFRSFSSASRFAANARSVLRADGDGVWRASLMEGVWGPAQRLPVLPCAETQVCGLSLAADDSWLVSGYWGHFLGQGQKFLRLPLPLSASEEFGVAIAHQGLNASFIYLGSDDGDRGDLPPWKADESLRSLSDRWFVWSQNPLDSRSLLIPQALESGSSRAERRLYLSTWPGPLPDALPSDWIAWEAAQEFSAPPLPQNSRASASWWQDQLGTSEAQALARAAGIEAQPVHAAVIDSGIALDHPWLYEQRFIAPGEIPGNGLDDDDNGYVDDSWGYDFVDEDPLPEDSFGHGTHVAGLLMARRGSEIKTPAPNLRLTVVRTLDRYGKSNSIDLARGILYALDRGALLINCSWGGGSDTQALRDIFATVRARGRFVISSAGNDRLNTDTYPDVPKKYPGVISVGAIDQEGRLASFSNFGQRSVTWLTPGDAIVSTMKNGDFGPMSGTSMAAPLGTASLAWIYGLLLAGGEPLSETALSEEAQNILCQTGDQGGLGGKSQCGRLRLDEATRATLARRVSR